MKFDLLSFIKKHGRAGLKELAAEFSVSQEAVRKQVVKLEAEGYIANKILRNQKAGRPMTVYSLSEQGEELFPRKYDDLAIALVEAVSESLEPKQTRKVFDAIIEKKISFWQPLLAGLSFTDKIKTLKKIYLEDDSFMEIEQNAKSLRMIESNCPYLKVAMHQPALCNITVTLLARLLDADVRRVQKFQEGHGRCVFEITQNPVRANRRAG